MTQGQGHFDIISDMDTMKEQAEAVGRGECEQCLQLIACTLKEHKKLHFVTDVSDCAICSDKIINLATLHFRLHTKFIRNAKLKDDKSYSLFKTEEKTEMEGKDEEKIAKI